MPECSYQDNDKARPAERSGRDDGDRTGGIPNRNSLQVEAVSIGDTGEVLFTGRDAYGADFAMIFVDPNTGTSLFGN